MSLLCFAWPANRYYPETAAVHRQFTADPIPLDHDAAEVPRALIVDDDPVLRLAITQFLGRLGFQTASVENGRMAVEHFDAEGADIVLLDAAMPVMDGFQACRGIRALSAGKRVPIIMITAYEDEASIDQSFDAGVTEYITKPILWAVLRNRTRYLVQAARTEQRLRNDWAFFQSLVDSIPDPTVVIDRDGLTRWINVATKTCLLMAEPVIEQALRLDPATRVIAQSDQCPDETDTERLLPGIRAHLSRSNQPLRLMLHRHAPDGSDHYAEVYGRALRGASGAAYGFILRFHDVTEREIEKQSLNSEVQRVGALAHSDPLTGLANRLLFEQRLREALYSASTQTRRLALLFIDLDGFKAVNDSLGHAAGDEVLKAVSTRLRDAVRDGDTVARFGGDEFAVLLTDIRQDASVEALGRRLLATIAQPILMAGQQYQIGASIGVSLYPEHGDNGKVLIERADQAMYAVKRSGKNDICFG